MKRATLFLLLMGCGRETTEADIKFVGVGNDPGTISAAPEPAGGLVSLDWINFAGDQLPLALLGFSTFEAAGPSLQFKEPYALVVGLSFLFTDDVEGTEALYGNFAAPSSATGICQMVKEPQAFLESATADAGDHMALSGGDMNTRIDRLPAVYPADPQDVFPYYQYISSWRTVPSVTYVRTDPAAKNPYDLEARTLEYPNFIHGETVEVSFPGAIPPIEANTSSVPVPLASEGSDTSVVLPERANGVRLSWTGPRYDKWGGEIGSGEQATCLQFMQGESPAAVSDCVGDPEYSEDVFEVDGNVYTGPWDTEDGVLFEWLPGEQDDVVSVTVRFLGPVDPTETFLIDPYVSVTPNASAEAAWSSLQSSGSVPPDAVLEEGYRPAQACDPDEDIEWRIDPTLEKEDGSYVPTLQGNPLHTMVEMTCTFEDASGSFKLTDQLLAPAAEYAEANGAEGAIFYFTRTQRDQVEIPPVRDRFGKKHETSAVNVVSNSIEMGRFWYGQ